MLDYSGEQFKKKKASVLDLPFTSWVILGKLLNYLIFSALANFVLWIYDIEYEKLYRWKCRAGEGTESFHDDVSVYFLFFYILLKYWGIRNIFCHCLFFIHLCSVNVYWVFDLMLFLASALQTFSVNSGSKYFWPSGLCHYSTMHCSMKAASHNM